jgi:GNS1/SUR4 family
VTNLDVDVVVVPQVQFLMVFVHSANALFSECGYPKLISAFLVVHSCIFFGLFLDFYMKAYRREHSAKTAAATLALAASAPAPTLMSLAPVLTPAAEGPTPKPKTQ